MKMSRVSLPLALVAVRCACAMQASIWETNEGEFTTYRNTGDKALARAEPDLAFVADDGSGAAYVFNIDPSTEFQEFLGFGSSFEGSSTYNMGRLSATARENLIESIVDPTTGIGLDLFRICIGSSDFTEPPFYTYQDTSSGVFDLGRDHDHIIPALKIAMEKNPDVLFFASPWSPPAWMKDSGTLLGGNMLDTYFDKYADYLVNFIRAYEAEGIPIYAITPQNEPRLSKPTYPTCYWTGEQERDFIKRFLGPKLQTADLDTKIWTWDHNWDKPERDFPYIVLDDPDAKSYVDGTAWHHYRGDPVTMTNVHNEHPDKHQYFTEGSKFGVQGSHELLDILRNWSRTYNAWVTFLDPNGQPNPGPYAAAPTMVVYDNNGDDITYTYDYYAYGQFARFIQRGAVRIFSEDGDNTVGSIAFRNPDGTIVVVVVNQGRSAKSIKIAHEGLVMRRNIDSKSILTFVWESTAPPTTPPAPTAAAPSAFPSASTAPSEVPFTLPSNSPSISAVPSAAAPPNSGPITLYVSSIIMDIETHGPNWEAVATVHVEDQDGEPIAGASVSGSWSDLINVGVTDGTTGADGTVVLNSGKTRDSGTITFCVGGIVLSGYDYSAGDCESIMN